MKFDTGLLHLCITNTGPILRNYQYAGHWHHTVDMTQRIGLHSSPFMVDTDVMTEPKQFLILLFFIKKILRFIWVQVLRRCFFFLLDVMFASLFAVSPFPFLPRPILMWSSCGMECVQCLFIIFAFNVLIAFNKM